MTPQGKDKLVNMETALTTKIDYIKAEEKRLGDEKTKAQRESAAIRERYANADRIPANLKKKLEEYDKQVKEAERKEQEAADLRKIYEDKRKAQTDAADAEADKKKRKPPKK